jgi:hypothetical protein
MFPKRISQISSFSHVLVMEGIFLKKIILTHQNLKKTRKILI